jgi:hypothetical protein
LLLKVESRAFEDENGKVWVVTKDGPSLQVTGQRNIKETLREISLSCARKSGITHTQSGLPLENINQHRRIWTTIWENGRPVY